MRGPSRGLGWAAVVLACVVLSAGRNALAADDADATVVSRAEEGSSDEGSEAAVPEGAFEPLATDRPGNGNAATVVPHLRLQLETSGAYLHDEVAGVHSHQVSFPTMLRFGLFDWVELRAGSALIGLDASNGAEAVSSTDTSLGVKVRILDNEGAVPALAAMADIFLPTGQNGFTSDVVVPEARLAAAWGLPAGFGLLLNAGVDVPEDPTGAYARFIHVFNVGYTLPVWEQRVSFFAESFGRTSFASGRGSIQQIDLGVAVMVARRIQLDFFTQHGLSNAPQLQLALGFSTRF